MRMIRVRQRAGMAAMMGFAVLLAACGGGSKLIGKSLPDETQVIDGPTLALPPQFELRPPREAADYESVLRAQKGVEAMNLITTGTSATVPGAASAAATGEVPAGDDWLVQKTAAQTGIVADPNVRADLKEVTPEEAKAAEEAKAKKGLLGRWFGGSDDE